MRTKALDYIACPLCKQVLVIESVSVQDAEHIIEGILQCTQCTASYPIINGIPRLIPAVSTHRDLATGQTYLDYFFLVSPNGTLGNDTVYGLTVQGEIEDFCHKTGVVDLHTLDMTVLLDAGCGLGRIDGELAKYCQDVVAFDITPAVEQAFRAWQNLPNVHIVQGDMMAIPVRSKVFDVVWCDGVIPYVSNWELGMKELLRVRKEFLYTWCYGPNVTINERLGRLGHKLRLPIKVRSRIFRIFAILGVVIFSIIRRQNLLNRVRLLAQSLLDWSLAGHVNHISEVQLRKLVNDNQDENNSSMSAKITTSSHSSRVEIHLGSIKKN